MPPAHQCCLSQKQHQRDGAIPALTLFAPDSLLCQVLCWVMGRGPLAQTRPLAGTFAFLIAASAIPADATSARAGCVPCLPGKPHCPPLQLPLALRHSNLPRPSCMQGESSSRPAPASTSRARLPSRCCPACRAPPPPAHRFSPARVALKLALLLGSICAFECWRPPGLLYSVLQREMQGWRCLFISRHSCASLCCPAALQP